MDAPKSLWDDAVVVGCDDVLECNEANIIPQEQNTIAKIRTWLQPTDFDGEGSEYQKHLSSHLAGTGEWFLTSSVYQQWHSGNEHGMLWARGIPGSGKSVLAAKVIHKLLQEQVPVLYLFFRQIVDANNNPRAALQDWLAQALIHSPPVQLQLKAYLGDSKRSFLRQESSQPRELESVSTFDLWQHLRTALSHLNRAYIVVDALDEMDQGQDTDIFLHHLSDLASWRPSQVKILMTSRPVASVERLLRKETLLRLRLDEEKVDQDIDAYVQSRLNASTVPPEMRAPIRAAVPGKARGLFLYAKLAMDALLKEGVDVRRALREIPENLHHMYTQLLNEHATKPGVSRDLQLLIMQWVTHSVRPLRLIEMSDMLIHDPTFNSQELGAAKRIVRSACGVLLELFPDETLCVVHHSLTEFLRGDSRADSKDYPILEPGPVNHRLALVCLLYLQNGCLADAEPERLSSFDLFNQAPKEPLLAPFTRYAALNWGTHVRRSSELGMDPIEVNDMLDTFTAHAHFQKWVRLAGLQTDTTRIITPLSMAALLGLSDYMQHLLARPDTDRNEGAPIAWAADKGFADIVSLLIQGGVDVNQYDAEGYTALHRAAIKNHPKVARALLNAGCDMNTKTRIQLIHSRFPADQRSALWYACNHGHVEIVAEFQVDMGTSKDVTRALTVAVEFKRAGIVRQLLKHPLVDVNRSRTRSDGLGVYNEKSTLLRTACSKRDLDTIELLVAAGADVNTYALHALASSKEAKDSDSSMRCFTLLIEAGADLNAPEPSQYHNTPLHRAADTIAAKMLLNAGANVEAENSGKETPLHTCRDVGVLTMLVSVGKANLEKTDSSSKTPLLAAMDGGWMTRKDTAEILALIDLGANVNVVDKDGNGVFHLAIKKYRCEFPEGLISRLCTAGADINRPNNRGEAPIHLTKIEISRTSACAPIKFPKKINQFEVLFVAGARLAPASASVSRTPLFNWIGNSLCDADYTNLAEVLATLVQCGASLDITDDQGRTLLHKAVRSTHHRAQIQFLLEQGLDPKATDYEGNTLWHEAASDLANALYDLAKGPAEPFDQLKQMDIDPTTPNHNGRTPLHVLSTLWPGSVYDFKRTTGSGIGSGHLNHTTAFDVMLSLYPEVDIADRDGVTPLHAASTFCEYLVRRLLKRDTDPSCVTTEGCNAIHLAARSRMPNIVGLLLETLRSCSIATLESAVRAKDHLGKPPLYYACIAGSYESAKLLVDAGAMVVSADFGSSPWKGIAEHEAEIKCWSNYSDDKSAGAVFMDDKRRPTGQGGHYRQDRIDELIALLVATQAPETTIMDQAIAEAASLEADYTVECLLRARASLQHKTDLVVTTHITASTNRRWAKRAELEMPCTKCKEMHCNSPLQRARIMQDYRLLPGILLAEGQLQSLPNTEQVKSILRDLVSNGFASVLRHLVAIGGSQALDDRHWNVHNVQQATTQFGFDNSHGQGEEEPLLLRACRRDVSNIDVIRVLVEQAGHDVNAQQHIDERPETYYQSFSDVGRYVQGESALHALVRGEHWWHVSQGLCYFLEHNADTELRDIHGMTPLSAALNRCGWLIFEKRAVELLVQHSADVNVIDRAGNWCLAKACSDMGMVKLLLDNGAVVTQSALIQAIKLKDVDLLALLLSYGADPNVSGRTSRPGDTRIHPDDYFPLHYLLSPCGSDYGRLQTASDVQKQRSMIKLLFDHGANPCARYDDTTILHELLRGNVDINSLFMSLTPGLDLETRNVSGETPLLLALQRTGSPDKTKQGNVEGRGAFSLLVSHRADIRVLDYHGNNVLHFLAKNGGYHPDLEDFVRIVREAPELVNQANNEGCTPLHIVMKGASNMRVINFFLENGADIHAADIKGDSMLHLLLHGEWKVCKHGGVKGRVPRYFNRLLALGADINVQNKAGETPIFSFFRHGTVVLDRERVTKLQHTAGETPRRNVSSQSAVRLDSESVRYPGSPEQSVYDLFTKSGVDWRVINGKGQNLLHVAASAPPTSESLFQIKRSPCHKFKALVELGLDAGLEDESGRTPLDIAADLGHKDILEWFRDR